jgi:hypothetical protein
MDVGVSMRDNFHPNCPRCKGAGFYLTHYGRGYYHDGSYGHNRWEDCTCFSDDDEDELPQPVTPTGEPF